MPKHHSERLNFAGSGYYGALSSEDGYGGFNYIDYMEYLNASYWNILGWCYSGYQNVTDASKGATGCAYVYEDGLMESANLKETFSLTSMIAASAWDTDAVWYVNSYSYAHGALKLKASDTMTISQTATKIDFAKLGRAGDFKNISALTFQLKDMGSAGYGCTDTAYGGATYGVQFAFDALKVKWNGKIPTGGGHHKLVLPPGLASHHHLVANPWGLDQHGAAQPDTGAANHNAAAHHAGSAYHSQLLSLSEHDPYGLTAQFHLTAPEHFGT
jgi:hypothetical protein